MWERTEKRLYFFKFISNLKAKGISNFLVTLIKSASQSTPHWSVGSQKGDDCCLGPGWNHLYWWRWKRSIYKHTHFQWNTDVINKTFEQLSHRWSKWQFSSDFQPWDQNDARSSILPRHTIRLPYWSSWNFRPEPIRCYHRKYPHCGWYYRW